MSGYRRFRSAGPFAAALLPALAAVLGASAIAGCSSPTDDHVAASEDQLVDPSTAVDLEVGTLPIDVPVSATGEYRAIRFKGIAGSSVIVSVRARNANAGAASFSVGLLRGDLTPIASGPGVVRATLGTDGDYYAEIVAAAGAAAPPPGLTIAVAAFVPLASTDDVGTTWDFPKTGSESWRALHPRDVDDVWATGDSAVLHFSGGSGKRYRLADDAHLGAVWAASNSDVWVGGSKLFHFDGVTWSEAVRPVKTRTAQLLGTASNDVWQRIYDPNSNARVVRWDGERWTDATPQYAKGGTLTVAAADDAFLFGIVESRAQHFDGSAWQTDIDPAESYFSPETPAVDASPMSDLGTAVIFASTRSGDVRVRDAGGVWHGISSFTGRYPLGLRYEGADLQSVWGQNAAKLWVTQRNGTDVFRRVRSENERWRAGSEWLNVPSAVNDAFVRGAPDGTAWFAGAQGQLGKQSGDDQVVAVTDAGPTCAAVARAPSGTVWAACEGTLRKKSGGAWTTIPIAGASRENPILALWAESDARVWFATASGAVLKLDDGAVTTLGTFADTRFVSVSGTSATNVFFTSTSSLARWDGNALTTVDPGRTDVGAAWAAGPNALFVGAGKSVMRFDGATWSTSTTLGDRVTRVAGSAANDVYAASDDELVRFDGVQWSAVSWKASLPAACASTRITTIATSSDGSIVLATAAGCIGTYASGAFTWVKRPVIVGSVVVSSGTSILGTASTGGVVTMQR